MARMIELSDDVYRRLQELAEPLVDSASDVIMRYLPREDDAGTPAVAHSRAAQGSSKNGTGRKRKYGEGISMKEYRPYILRALLNQGGRAHLARVKEYIKAKLGNRFDDHDLDLTQSNAIVWENRVEWQRLEMRQDGLIAEGSPKGIWELTPQGIEAAKRLSPDEG